LCSSRHWRKRWPRSRKPARKHRSRIRA
jgi:hypothetical protein